MLENYILLQNFLCGDRIIFDYDAKVDSDRTYIPKMLLQPLVENCIMHNNGNDFVEIKISCFVGEKKFCIVVEDNGSGRLVDNINQTLREADDNSGLKEHGIGICNVNQRIKMRYGESFRLHYTRTEEGGVAACVELPDTVAILL
ncbi:MAG: hypothetical protein IJ390_00050 [Lachnospiraceae bacterium]|nr:hypothetical protein [Lachnospiraceae bacterium]